MRPVILKVAKAVKAAFWVQTAPSPLSPFSIATREKIVGQIKSFVWGIISCDGSFLDTVLYLDALEVPPHLSQNCRNAATKVLKSCASWSPVLRMMWHGSIDVAPFCRRGGNKKCPNGCRNAAAHASQGRCGVADFWGRVRGNFFGRKIWNVGMASGRHNRHVFFDGGVSFIETENTAVRPSPYAVSCRGVFHGFLRWVRLIMNRHTSAYITWTSLMVHLKI